MTAEIRIGVSGWTYRHWRGRFYPPGLTQRRELEFASRAFNALEINGSFYSLQRPSSYRRWRDATPQDFVFAVKGSRYITHLKKLGGGDQALANFLASGVLALGDKLGPILWQLPPMLAYREDRMREFFASLPFTAEQAATVAARCDDRIKTRFGEDPVITVERPGCADPPCGRGPARLLRHRRLRPALPGIRHRAGRRGHRRQIHLGRRGHRRPCLCPAARRPGVVRQWLHRSGHRLVGGPGDGVGADPGRPAGAGVLRQRPPGPRALRRAKAGAAVGRGGAARSAAAVRVGLTAGFSGGDAREVDGLLMLQHE